ncbi:hypothetical protein Daus18300_010403 [Diaporthe australafricana]|uniref:Uncharacterized protein n=1 Tax=Diaporthe australafricana TaxID=127596 RepID=A0ABR3WB96_9PEZI
MTKHKKLDEAHNRVCMAEKKLAKNTNPSQTEHCEKMVLRNMELRENLRSECERIERGEAAGLTVEEAYAKTKGLAEKMLARGASCYRNDERLRLKYPEAVGPNGTWDTTKLNKKDRESQVSTSNWFKNAHSKLVTSFPDLLEAMEGDPNYHFASKTLVSTFHSLGCYTAGSCWLWPMRPDIQMQFSNPDPITWPCAPQPEQSPPLAGYQAQPDQSSAQHHQEAQPMEIDFPGISEAYRLVDQAGNPGSQSGKTQQPEEPQGQEQNHDTEMTEPVELTDEELETELKVLIAALEDTPVQAPPEERLEEWQTDETNIDPSLRILAEATARGFSREATSTGDQTTAPSEGHEKAQINYDELVKDVGGRTFTDAEMFDCATNPGC